MKEIGSGRVGNMGSEMDQDIYKYWRCSRQKTPMLGFEGVLFTYIATMEGKLQATTSL